MVTKISIVYFVVSFNVNDIATPIFRGPYATLEIAKDRCMPNFDYIMEAKALSKDD